MKKLSLNIEELEVNSFETASADDGRGTVQGAEAADGTESWGCSIHPFCFPWPISWTC